MPFIPHTEDDVREMLSAIGAQSIDDLFDEIPTNLRAKRLTNVPEGVNELEISRIMQQRAKQDEYQLNFIGAGAYEHHIPAAVWDITTRGEFMTAYTPYQAEASQGTLQLLYEYQTMMASLMGMDVSNASLYDGASSLAEAILMAVRANRNTSQKHILIAGTVHPHYRQVAQNIVQHQGIEISIIDYNCKGGHISLENLKVYQGKGIAALVIQQPNFFGTLEEIDQLTDWAHQQDALVIAVVNPIATALLKEPGQWGQTGADIVCGEGQPLGIPLASGGPYFGFICCKQDYVRQMPGRIIGRTIDRDSKTGFTLTLQAREQHIRRSKATSNICTNQGLLVTAATIYMSLLGFEGLKQVALACVQNTDYLLQALQQIPGIYKVFNRPVFHEIVIQFDKPVSTLVARLAAQGIQPGFDISHHYPGLNNCLLICTTETKTKQDIDLYTQTIKQILAAI